MCTIFADQSPEDFLPVKRSVRIQGHSTSIRLENFFWKMIDRIAEKEGTDTPKFLNTLLEELLELQEGKRNFTSLIRVGCCKYSLENMEKQVE